MLVVVVPVILATLGFAWWYRASNARANRSPEWAYQGRIEFVIWSIPALIVILVGGVAWIGSHQLDPRAPIASNAKPIRVDVVSLDWKWLFIYPDQRIAAVNQLVVPAGTPVSFRLTSATVMNSFFVPQLGSQIYTMAGMATNLNLLADKPGKFPGLSAKFSGDGFAECGSPSPRCPPAISTAGSKRCAARDALDDSGYGELAKPSHAVPPATYRSVDPEAVPADRRPDRADPESAAPARPGVHRRSRQGAEMLGRLGWEAIPFDEPIALSPPAVAGIAVLAVLAIITRKGWWPYLWREWLTSVDHKRIGVMYTLLALVMLLRGFSDAIMMRSQQAIAIGGAQGYLPPDHYNQIFSAHGTIMIFFVAMPFVVGLMNFVVPLQLGVRDVAFPVLNSVSFWLTASGALLINLSLVIGNFARTGWLVYPPLSELAYSPDVGVDYYLWSLQIRASAPCSPASTWSPRSSNCARRA